MRWLPFDRFSVLSMLPPDEVLQRLQNCVAPRPLVRFSKCDKPFEGTVNGTAFMIQRVTGYRNSFLPQIDGKVESAGTGSRTTVFMFAHPYGLVFMLLWSVFMTFALVSTIKSVIEGRESGGMICLPIAMLGFGYGLVMGSYKFEAQESRRQLTDIVWPEGALEE